MLKLSLATKNLINKQNYLINTQNYLMKIFDM